MSYDDYIETDHWKRICKSYLRDHATCAVCGAPVDPESPRSVIHLDYHAVGREGPSHLMTICPRCGWTMKKAHEDLKPTNPERF